MKFRLLPKVGNHAETGEDGSPCVYKPGDIVESDRDLVDAFPGKFERVVDGVEDTHANPFKPTTKEKTAVQKAAEEGAKDVGAPDPEDPNPLGREVTKRFPTALDEDFLVFADGGAFSVAEADEPTVPLNDKPLKRKDVGSFIRKYLET